MLLIVCMNCHTAVRVMGNEQELNVLVGKDSEYWPDKYTCVTCDQPCEGMAEHEADQQALLQMKVRDLTPQEFYAALNGLGTPDEMRCDGATVREIFQTKKVVKVQGADLLGTTRFVLHELVFEDGTMMSFGAGPRGAVVFRIKRAVSYAKKVLDHG
jgi:hypothetical protein